MILFLTKSPGLTNKYSRSRSGMKLPTPAKRVKYGLPVKIAVTTSSEKDVTTQIQETYQLKNG